MAAEREREVAEETRVREEEIRRRQQEILASIELRRADAERAAEEARMRAEELRFETERMREEAEFSRHESEEMRAEQAREFARAREEISRTHRELRRASQEVAHAHRDLMLAEDRRLRTRVINLGDRAMLGVILGNTTPEGIEIVGLSPDGPAERAGIQTGDVLVSLRGESLAADGENSSARDAVMEVMSDVENGEEIAADVLRDGKQWSFMVEPEKREPASWASYIRLPEAVVAPTEPGSPAAAPTAPTAPVAPHIRLETISVPPLDAAALASDAEALVKQFETIRATIADEDGALSYEYAFDLGDFEFDHEAFSEIGAHALSEASVWFGTAATSGIRFSAINEDLGAYFGADRGVLVLDAPETNVFGLRAGDVVLKIGGDDVNGTADIVRALRGFDAGETVTLAIKRNKREQNLEGVMPDNRVGFLAPSPD